MVKVDVEGVVLNLTTHSPVVILRSKAGQVLPIVIGIFEAQAILLGLEKSAFPRPLTHDLIKVIVETMAGRMLRLEIDNLAQNVYHANVILEIQGELRKIDCRPSDGIALAIRFGAPVFAEDGLLEPADTIKYYKGKKFVKVHNMDKPIQKKEVEDFMKGIENLSTQDFWKKP